MSEQNQSNTTGVPVSFQNFFNSLNGGQKSVDIKTTDGTPIEVTAELKNNIPVLKAKKKGSK